MICRMDTYDQAVRTEVATVGWLFDAYILEWLCSVAPMRSRLGEIIREHCRSKRALAGAHRARPVLVSSATYLWTMIKNRDAAQNFSASGISNDPRKDVPFRSATFTSSRL